MVQKEIIQKEIIKHVYLSGYGKYEMILLLGRKELLSSSCDLPVILLLYLGIWEILSRVLM